MDFPQTPARGPRGPVRIRGQLRVTPAGFGLVPHGVEKVYLAHHALGAALDGDEVEITITHRGDKGLRGRLHQILARPARRLMGTVDDAGRFVPDDARFGEALRCTGLLPPMMAKPMLCGAELQPVSGRGEASVLITRHFGLRGEPRVEEDAILWREGVTVKFSPAIQQEAEKQARSVYANPDQMRADLRDMPFITVDPATAEDHDDAVFARRVADGAVHVFVAIADVAAFVPAESELDREARRRGTSLYLSGRVIPMLPPVLCNDAASLVPDTDRAAVVLDLVIDAEGRPQTPQLSLGLIRSRAKLTYEDARDALQSQGRAGSSTAQAHYPTLELLDAVAQRLRGQRQERGALAIETPELQLQTDAGTGLPLSIRQTAPDAWLDRSHQLIEELMLLANETVAKLLHQEDSTFLFRQHEAPGDERTARVVQQARDAGVELPEAGLSDATGLRQFMASSEKSVQKQLTAWLLEALPAASYVPQREEHFALASSHYVHFTSPIRRYADITVHRAIRRLLEGAPSTGEPAAAEDANRGQERARNIQREVADLHAALLMQHEIGGEYSGKVLRALTRQYIVGLSDPYVCVRCPRTDLDLKEGAQVRVRIDRVSLPARTIEASVVGTPA